MERESGVFPIVLPRDSFLSGLGCVVYFYHLQAGELRLTSINIMFAFLSDGGEVS